MKKIIKTAIIIMMAIITLTTIIGCANNKYQKYAPYYIYGAENDSHEIISWKNESKSPFDIEHIDMSTLKDYKREGTLNEKTISLFGIDYTLYYDDTMWCWKYWNDEVFEIDNYDTNDTEFYIGFYKNTDTIMSASHGNKAMVKFDTNPSDFTPIQLSNYYIEFAKKYMSEIYNLDGYEARYVKGNGVEFYKIMNGYKIYSFLEVTIKLENVVGGETIGGGITGFMFANFESDYQNFENTKIDEKKLNAAIDKAYQEIDKNTDKYGSIEIKTEKYLVVNDGNLYVRVDFVPTAILKQTGEKREQAPLVVMIRVS